MRIERNKTARVFVLHDLQGLDPVTVILDEPVFGKGKLTVECYGQSWSAYWGAMGKPLTSFLVGCHPEYIADKLEAGVRKQTNSEKAYLRRIVNAVHDSLSLIQVM